MKRLSLTRLVFDRRREQPAHTFPGDACPCPGCTGSLVVYDSRVDRDSGLRTRYMRCAKCGHLPQNNKWVE